MQKKEVQDLILLLQSLPEDNWGKLINDRWTIRDVVSHLTCWNEELCKVLPLFMRSGQLPWFTKTTDFDEFNIKSIEKYKNLSASDLLSKFIISNQRLESTFKDIDVDNLTNNPNFSWVFNADEKNHYQHHEAQIRNALKNK